MTKQPNIPDAEIDRLLAGHAPEDSRLDGVAQFLADVSAAHAEDSASTLEPAHVAAMVAAAQALAEQAETADLDPQLEQKSRRAGPFPFANLAAHKWATAAVVAVMAVLAFGGAAYAGVLPAPIQEVTSSCASQVGVAIPRAHVRSHSGANEASVSPKARRSSTTSGGAKRANGVLRGAGASGGSRIGSGSARMGSTKAKIGVVSGSAVPTPTAGSSAATGSVVAARAKSAHAKVQAKAKAHARARASVKATKKVHKKSRAKARKRTKVKKRRTRRSVERGESDRSTESSSEAESRRERRRSSRG